MSKSKKQLTTIPYVSEWDLDEQGRPIGLIAALVHMLAGWVGQGVAQKVRRFTGLPGPTLLKDELDALGLSCHLEFARTYLSPIYGDLCLINYERFPRELVQDVNFRGWEWVIFLWNDEKNVYIHDPNWGGSERQGGEALAIPLEAWEASFTPHTAGLQAIRLNARGPEQIVVPPERTTLIEEDVAIIEELAQKYESSVDAENKPEGSK